MNDNTELIKLLDEFIEMLKDNIIISVGLTIVDIEVEKQLCFIDSVKIGNEICTRMFTYYREILAESNDWNKTFDDELVQEKMKQRANKYLLEKLENDVCIKNL